MDFNYTSNLTKNEGKQHRKGIIESRKRGKTGDKRSIIHVIRNIVDLCFRF